MAQIGGQPVGPQPQTPLAVPQKHHQPIKAGGTVDRIRQMQIKKRQDDADCAAKGGMMVKQKAGDYKCSK